jgi:hypothetical protein
VKIRIQIPLFNFLTFLRFILLSASALCCALRFALFFACFALFFACLSLYFLKKLDCGTGVSGSARRAPEEARVGFPTEPRSCEEAEPRGGVARERQGLRRRRRPADKNRAGRGRL